ncbi:hypothetical protein J3R82DRAFT_5039 [Butyriboletus roseoflavus]|nr:hypothetical protein J3R82DRAFT_5039 [Butyriboletus roseoflavus]
MNDIKITVHALRNILPLHVILDPTSRLPLIDMNNDIFQAWIEQKFYEAETSVCREMGDNPHRAHAFAYRALLQAHMNQQHIAIKRASQSLAFRPTIIGHIAKAVALVGQGQHEPAFKAFDIVFCNCGAGETRFLLLIRAILLFVSGKRENAIARVNDLIAVADDSAKYNCLQACSTIYQRRHR